MDSYPKFPVQHISCVDRDRFYQDTYMSFGNPIGSKSNAKVISDERCLACFEYLIQVELRDLSHRNCGRIVQKLKDLGYDLNQIVAHEQLHHFQNQPKNIQRELRRFFEMKEINKKASDLIQSNDDQKYQGGVKTQGIWGRQTKDLIGTGKRQRFFVELLPQPLGSKAQYRMIFFKDQDKCVIAPPSTWFDILTTMHVHHGHKGRDAMFALVRKKYFNVPKHAIERFTLLCKIRSGNTGSSSKVPRLMTPGFSPHSYSQAADEGCADDPDSENTVNKKPFLDRVHVFVISNQYTQHVKMDILCLRDFATNFIKLFPLERNTVDTVSYYIGDFMRTFGGIHVLHWSDDIESRFVTAVVETVNEYWEFPVVVGDSRGNSPEVVEIQNNILTYTKNFMLYHQSIGVVIDVKAWSAFLSSTTFALNCAIGKNGLSPYEEVFNREPNLSAVIPHLTHGRISKTHATTCINERDIKPATTKNSFVSTKKLEISDLLNDNTTDN